MFLASCQSLCLAALPVNAGAAKLLPQLNSIRLQGLMGSFINGCQAGHQTALDFGCQS